MAQRAMNCRATSICITDYIILFGNPRAAVFRNDPSCFAGSRMSLASCEPHSRETSNQLDEMRWYCAAVDRDKRRMLSRGMPVDRQRGQFLACPRLPLDQDGRTA